MVTQLTQLQRYRVKELAPKRAFAFVQRDGRTNAGWVIGTNGVLVVDSLMHPSLTEQLLSEIAKTTELPIKWLINTHYHGDHVLGNQFFKMGEWLRRGQYLKMQATIVAQEACASAFVERAKASLQQYKTNMPELADEFKRVTITPPDQSYKEKKTIDLGNCKVQLLHFDAHTPGDTVVYIPDYKLVFGGDILAHRTVPVARDGNIGKWQEVLDKILALDVETLVPGHGPAGPRIETEDLREYFQLLRRDVKKAFDARKSVQEASKGYRVAKYNSWINGERTAGLVEKLYQEFQGRA